MKTIFLLITLIIFAILFIMFQLSQEPDDISNMPHSLVPEFRKYTGPSRLYSRTHQLQKTDYNTLIDIDFKFETLCHVCSNESPTFLLIMVHSAVGHFEKRRAIRETWGRSSYKTKLVFLLGSSDKSEMMHRVKEEAQTFSDLVVGSFMDTYRNLTYKHVMGLKYALHHCKQATYVLKTDDDVFVNTPGLVEYMKKHFSPYGAEKLLACNVWRGANVARSHRSKYRFSFKEFPSKNFPTYCSGWFILYSPDVVYELYKLAQKSDYFWVDDVFVTGILAEKAEIPHFNLKNIVMSKRKMDKIAGGVCDGTYGRFLLGRPNIGSDVVRKLWTCAMLSDREIDS